MPRGRKPGRPKKVIQISSMKKAKQPRLSKNGKRLGRPPGVKSHRQIQGGSSNSMATPAIVTPLKMVAPDEVLEVLANEFRDLADRLTAKVVTLALKTAAKSEPRESRVAKEDEDVAIEVTSEATAPAKRRGRPPKLRQAEYKPEDDKHQESNDNSWDEDDEQIIPEVKDEAPKMKKPVAKKPVESDPDEDDDDDDTDLPDDDDDDLEEDSEQEGKSTTDEDEDDEDDSDLDEEDDDGDSDESDDDDPDPDDDDDSDSDDDDPEDEPTPKPKPGQVKLKKK